MAPFGYLPVDASRYWFIFFNTVAMIIAAYLLIRLFKFTVTSVAFPALLAAMFCTEAVVNTLVFANINGIILLLEVLFFRWMLDGKVRPSVVGRRRGRAVAGGQTAAGAAALAAAAQPAMAGARHRGRGAAGVQPGGDAVGRRPDELLQADAAVHFRHRDYFNSSISGQRALLRPADVADRVAAHHLWLLAVASLWLLYRYYRTRDPLFWFCTSSGVLLIASWLVPSLGQAYYSMTLFPFLMTVVLRNSVIRNWPAWLAVYGFLSADSGRSSTGPPPDARWSTCVSRGAGR